MNNPVKRQKEAHLNLRKIVLDLGATSDFPAWQAG